MNEDDGERTVPIFDRGLTLRAWIERALEDELPREQIIEVAAAWPRAEEAKDTLYDLRVEGRITREEHGAISAARAKGVGSPWFAGYDGSGRRVRVLNGVVRNLHLPRHCQGRPCWIHAPSAHPLLTWPILFRDATASAERVCRHWATHPDPDDVAYRRHADLPVEEHDCACRCCRDELDDVRIEAARREALCRAGLPDLAPLLTRFGPTWSQWAAIDCGDGWHRLLVRMDARIQEVAPNVRYAQIKEKFAELRVYLDNTSLDGVTRVGAQADVAAAIADTALEASTTCELCGSQPARLVAVGWHRTLCDVHEALHLERHGRS